MTFRVLAGLSAIWAGTVRELRDGTFVMVGTKHNVTEDVLAAATKWLAEKNIEWGIVLESGRKITLKVEIEETEKETEEAKE